MKGDFTRLTFDKKKHYRGVLMQQGRVQLDSDWNEQVQIAEYRYSTFLGDFVGQSGAPAGDAMAFSQQSSDALDLGDKNIYHRVSAFLIVNRQEQCDRPVLVSHRISSVHGFKERRSARYNKVHRQPG